MCKDWDFGRTQISSNRSVPCEITGHIAKQRLHVIGKILMKPRVQWSYSTWLQTAAGNKNISL